MPKKTNSNKPMPIEAPPTRKKSGPKPKTLTPEQVQELKTLGAFMTMEQAANYFGFKDRGTLSRILEENPDYKALWKQGKAKAIAMVSSKLMQLCQTGDRASIFFFLKTQAGWRETSQVDHTSSDGSMSPKGPVIDAGKLSDSALQELLNASKTEQ